MTFYEAFLAEMDKVTIKADAPAAAVVGACTRAAKRAQMVVDGLEVSAGPWVVPEADNDHMTPAEYDDLLATDDHG